MAGGRIDEQTGNENELDEEVLKITEKELRDVCDEKRKYVKQLADENDQAYEDAAVEDENPEYYPSEYEQEYESLIVLEEMHYETKDALAKLEQSKHFASIYLSEGTENYKKIIHKQSKESADKLNREEEAESIAEVIKEDKVKTVGIFGEWGTGKSTFLEFIKKKISEDSKIKIVDLKASEYTDRDKIWTYFYKEMKKKAFEGSVFAGIRHKIFPIIACLVKMVGAIIAYVAIYFVSIKVLEMLNLFTVMSTLMGVKADDMKNYTYVMYIFVGIAFVYKFLMPIILQVFEWIKGSGKKVGFSQKTVSDILGYKYEIKKQIEQILNESKQYHFVFFVDELDRCNSSAVMEFFESIQLIDDCPRVHIVYAVDEGVVLDAIKNAGFKNPQNYLKKYVDLRVYLESVNNMTECINNVASEYNFMQTEIKKIQEAIGNLDVNISVRELYHILNTLSELREKWINSEVKNKVAQKKSTNKDALNWYTFIPVAILYLEGSIWPRKIYQDFGRNKDVYVVVKNFSKGRNDYDELPDYIKNMYLIDIVNAIKFLSKTKPLFYMNEKELTTSA